VLAVVNVKATLRMPDNLWSRRSMRLRLVLLLCFGATSMSLMRNNFGIALVCMVNDTTTSVASHDNGTRDVVAETDMSACAPLTDEELTDYGVSSL